MRRRDVLALAVAAASWPRLARSQSTSPNRVGVLWPGAAPPPTPRLESLALGLRSSGYAEGSNLAIDLRYSDRGTDALRQLAAEMSDRGAKVIATFGDLATRSAQEAAKQIPIVGITDDIIEANLVSSLAHPGRNTTGLTLMSTDLIAKRFEFLKLLLPKMSRVAAFWDPLAGTSQVTAAMSSAKALKLELMVAQVRSAGDLEAAFRVAKDGKAEALNVFSSPVLASLFRPIVGSAAQYQLPAIYQWKEHVEAGGLISYGPGLAAMWRHVGVLIAKILRGAVPADLPVEQPLKFELAINLTTAQALGLALPPEILIRADEVIE